MRHGVGGGKAWPKGAGGLESRCGLRVLAPRQVCDPEVVFGAPAHAIGREGQNARLAAKLTGWRIDIRSDAGVAAAGAGAPRVATSDDDGDGAQAMEVAEDAEAPA